MDLWILAKSYFLFITAHDHLYTPYPFEGNEENVKKPTVNVYTNTLVQSWINDSCYVTQENSVNYVEKWYVG